MDRLPVILLMFRVFLFCVTGGAQNSEDQKKHFLFFDKITGIENSDLHYGSVYQEKHRVKSKKTKFFPNPDFVLGSVIFNGQPYFGIHLKYNVYDDELLMQVDKRFGGDILQLHKVQVNGFEIGGLFFTKIDSTALKSGFYEVSLENQTFSLLKKHHKSLRQLLGDKLVFYEFEDENKDYFLKYQDSYHPIEKISDFHEIFPKYEDELKAFHQSQDTNLSFDSRLESILSYLYTLLPGEKDKM